MLLDVLFFWNIPTVPQNREEYELHKIVQHTSGVTFEQYILDKAESFNPVAIKSGELNQYRESSVGPSNGISTPDPRDVGMSNGMNGNIQMTNSPYVFNGIVMQYPTNNSAGPMIFANGMQQPQPQQYSVPPNGYGFSNVNQQVGLQGPTLPPPPGFDTLYP